MKTILSAFLLLAVSLSAAPPATASTWGGVKVFASGSGSSVAATSGTVVDGANFSANDITASTIRSTGTAPSATLNGAVVRSSGSILGDGYVGGNLGIGMVSPSGPLEVFRSAPSVGRLAYFTADNGNAAGIALTQNGQATWDAYIPASTTRFALSANGKATEALSLTSAGNLGIGTVSPNGPLEVFRSAPAFGRVAYFRSDNGSPTGIALAQNGQITWDAYMPAFSNRFALSADGKATEALSLTSAGNLGIGTASPASKLDVSGDAQFGSGVNKATITAGGFWQPLSQTTLQASLLAPTSLGQYIQNSTINELCKSTGTLAGNWQKVDGGGGCF